MSSKYVYPAIFTPEENGGYSVLFPDLEGCYTCGDNLEDSLPLWSTKLSSCSSYPNQKNKLRLIS